MFVHTLFVPFLKKLRFVEQYVSFDWYFNCYSQVVCLIFYVNSLKRTCAACTACIHVGVSSPQSLFGPELELQLGKFRNQNLMGFCWYKFSFRQSYEIIVQEPKCSMLASKLACMHCLLCHEDWLERLVDCHVSFPSIWEQRSPS